MSSVVVTPKKRRTVQEYLELEYRATERHEYDNGEVLAMSGGSFRHSQVCLNVGSEFRARLRGKPCQALESNMRLGLVEAGRYVYPDVMVVCGPPVFDPVDHRQTTIRNPSLVLEVLPDSTESYDRGKKFTAYRLLESLREYVIISQSEPLVETYVRHEDGRWTLRSYTGLAAVAQFASLGIEIPLAEIYLNVNFQPRATPFEES